MRKRFLASSATLALTAVLAGIIAAATIDDDLEERIDDLEARVARLEAELDIEPDEASEDDSAGEPGEQGQRGSSSTSSSSSSSSSSTTTGSGSMSSTVQRGTNSYQASFVGTGDREIELDIRDGGVYEVSVQPAGSFSARLVTATGEEIPAFALQSDDGMALSADGQLEPGTYTLEVTSTGSWIINVRLNAS